MKVCLRSGKRKNGRKFTGGASLVLFKRRLLALVLDGTKVQTRRVHKQEWKVGKTYGVRDTWFSKPQGYIVILRKFRQRLAEISDLDVKKEGFSTLAEFKEEWRKINGSWNPELVVIAYEFVVKK